MDYMTVKEAAEKWAISMRHVQLKCKNSRIHGVIRKGKAWLIPANAERPADLRYKKTHEKSSIVRPQKITERHYSLNGDIYATPGTAEQVIQSVADNKTIAALLKVQLEYYRGNIEKAYHMAVEVEALCRTFETQVGLYSLLGVFAMYNGDVKMWERTRNSIADVACADENERVRRDFWLAVYDSSIFDNAAWPDWFRKGRLSVLPPDYVPFAAAYYIKYLLVHNYDMIRNGIIKDKISLKYLMSALPIACEPLIAQNEIRGSLVSEIYLRLHCATGYHTIGNDSDAILHIDRAIELALPDRIYAPLAENRSQLDSLLDERLKIVDESVYKDVRRLSDRLLKGWTALHNSMLDRNYSDELTAREREAARLAVYGLSNDEIGVRLGVSSRTAKDYIQKALEKTGARNRSELVRYV